MSSGSFGFQASAVRSRPRFLRIRVVADDTMFGEEILARTAKSAARSARRQPQHNRRRDHGSGSRMFSGFCDRSWHRAGLRVGRCARPGIDANPQAAMRGLQRFYADILEINVGLALS